MAKIGVKQHIAVTTAPQIPTFKHFPASLLLTTICQISHYNIGWPIPSALRAASLMPGPVQQSATFPSITTAGTLRTPRVLALSAITVSLMSSTVTSQEGQAILLTRSIVS
jgi:hypothetical protein